MKQALLLLLLMFSGTTLGQSSFTAENMKWRREREEKLKAEDGWLSVAGLFWLKQGTTTFGSDAKADIVLPAGSAPGLVGSLELSTGTVTLKVNDGVVVTMSDNPIREFAFKFDDDNPPPAFKVGSLSLAVIKRGERFGLRVRDKNSKARREFTGLRWYRARESYRVIARFTPYDQPKEITIMNVLGDELKMKTPGTLSFKLNGRTFNLRPVIEDDKELFIIFRDLTTGKTTYGAGRFLYTDLPKDGKVVLDFNRAENPPCAFTPFATCPLPPKENRLPIAINSGELAFHLVK
jgi:uncharacterized protein